MTFHFFKHVLEELVKRKISHALLEQVLQSPQQKMTEPGDITCYQSRAEIDGKQYLLRAMVNETVTPYVVVTVYRTSKISKYWRES